MVSSASDVETLESGGQRTQKRKLRVPKACYPCYRRKVKCDRKSPCSLCVKRGYAHLCTFTHPAKENRPSRSPTIRACHKTKSSRDENYGQIETLNMAYRTATVTAAGCVLVDTQEWQSVNARLAQLSSNITALRSRLETTSTSSESSSLPSSEATIPSPEIGHNAREDDGEHGGVTMRNTLGGSPVHCGSGSILAFLLQKPHGSVFQEDSVLSQLGLENHSATYPFLDLWSSDITSYSNGSVCAALPEDGICRRLLQSYRDIRMILYPVIADFDRFEVDVQTLLRNRALEGVSTTNAAGLVEQFGFSIAFVGMLFAVLASGCQVSDLSKQERTSMCQLYVSCAYQCLRNSNFLSRPTMETVQTLLIIGDVLSYNMNPGIAYITFGVAQRMALTLGLHAEQKVFRDPGARRRQQLWWSMAWQDSHFGLSYDRPVETLSPNPEIPRQEGSRPGMRGYFETMCCIISLILRLLREEVLAGSNINDRTIPAYKAELDGILADAEPYLQSEDYCFTLKDHIERLTVKLRSSYLVSEICRRHLKQTTAGDGNKVTPRLCGECINSLVDTIEAYIELHEIIPHGSRTWIHLHSSISSAFLLSVDEGAQLNPRVWSILERLEKVLSDLTLADTPDQSAQSPVSKNGWSPPAQAADPPSGDYFSSQPGLFEMTGFSAASYGQTFMLSDFPLAPDLPMFESPKLQTSDGGLDFLNGTLNSLRKVLAGIKLQKAKVGVAETAQTTGSCCASRCRS